MDRNIITVEAAAAHNRARAAEVQQMLQRYMREAASRPADLLPGTLGGEPPIDLQKPDSWYDRILKYVPVEVLSMYLALDTGIRSTTQDGSQERIRWLALALVCVVVFNFAYLVRILHVRSPWQTSISCVALVAYVYVNGGVFQALSLVWPQAQLFVLIVTGAVLIFFPLPDAGSVQSGAGSAGSAG